MAPVTPLASRAALVGRRDELAALDRAWERARTGRGTTVVVTGPPGIGRTTLIAELARRRDADGDLVLRAHCSPDPGAPDNWPWIQIVRQCVGLLPVRLLVERLGTRAQHLVRAVPELASTLEAEGVGPAPHRPGPPGTHFAFCDATLSLLQAIAGECPVAVAIDDVHWADAGSLRLLDLLCRSSVDAAALVVVTLRDVEPCLDPGAAGLLAGIARHGSRLALAGLSEAETALLMAGRAGDEPEAALVHEVHALTGGNPLFVDEAVRLLSTGASLAALDRVPASLLTTASRALDTLGDDELTLLQAAAIVGRDFSEGVLGAVLEERPERLHRRLVVAGGRGFVRPAAPGASTWALTDPVVREALLGRLDAREAARLHQRVADALRSGAAPGAARPAVIAEHAVASALLGPVGPAVECCRAAAAEATEARSHRDAVRWLEESVRLAYRATAATDEERFELLMSLGEAQARAGLARSAADTFERALRVAGRQGDAVATARAVLGAVEARRRAPGWDTTLDDVAALLDRTAADLGSLPGGHTALAARLLATRASVHALVFDPAAARACSDDCTALARASGDVEVHHAAVVAARWAALGPAPLTVKTELTDQLVLHAAQTGDQVEAWRAQQWRLDDGLEAGDPDVVNRATSMAMAVAEQLAEPDLVFHTLVAQATVALLEGRFGDARELHRRARQLNLSWEVPEEGILGQELYLGWEQGQVDLALVRVFAEVLPRPLARALVCWTTMIGGDREAAHREVERFFDEVGIEDVPDGNFLPTVLAMMAEAVARTGLVQHAGRVRDRLAPSADQCVVAGTRARVWGGSNHLYLGMLSTILGDHDAAERHLDAAERVHRRMGARCHLVRGQLWRARLAARRGDRARARALLDDTLRQADLLGMAPAADDARSGLDALGTAGPDAASPTRWALRRDGAAWHIEAAAASSRLRDRKGLGYLHTLLERPGREIHVLDLVGAGVLRGAGSAPQLDATAKEAYRRRVEDLRDQVDTGERWGDPARVARAQEELDAIAQELARSLGLGGRDRASDPGERARVSVTKAIRSAIDAVGAVAPAVGEHLVATVRTGYYCAYTPDPACPVTWDT